MIDNVLVSIKYNNELINDMEMPANIEVDVLSDMLLETLKTAEPEHFGRKNNLRLKCNGKDLSSGTLFENKVWDGSILEIF